MAEFTIPSSRVLGEQFTRVVRKVVDRAQDGDTIRLDHMFDAAYINEIVGECGKDIQLAPSPKSGKQGRFPHPKDDNHSEQLTAG